MRRRCRVSMVYWAITLIAGWLQLSGCRAADEVAPLDKNGPLVIGYYPSWASDPTPQAIPYQRFTHIIHAFAGAGDNGAVQYPDTVPSSALVSAAHAAGTKVILGIGGGGNGPKFTRMARDKALRAAFVADIVKAVQDTGYDGVDIDWEFPEKGDETNVVELVHEFRAALRAVNPELLLTMALPASNWNGQHFDVARFHDQVDFVQIMSYDFHGPWNHAGHNTQLHETSADPEDGSRWSFDKILAYWGGKGFKRSQLLMGIPSYARGFAATKFGEKPTEKSKYEEISYKQVVDLLKNGWVREWDDEAKMPWMHKPGLKELISYEDEESARLKGAWAKQVGVRGIFFWAISQDFIDGDNVLVKAAREGFGLDGATVEPAALEGRNDAGANDTGANLLQPAAMLKTGDTLLFDDFTAPDGLLTNEYTFWNPKHEDAVNLPNWDLNSGTLFIRNGVAWTGVPDNVSPNAQSSNGTDSAVFRLITKKDDFRDVAVSLDLKNKGLSATERTPAVDWDGVHVFLRYASEESLYYASVNRRDNTTAIKKKVPGGPSNGGTYYTLATGKFETPYNQWQHVKATIQTQADGSVAIELSCDGKSLLKAVDRGEHGAVIPAGRVGLRGDNAELEIDNFLVESIPAAA